MVFSSAPTHVDPPNWNQQQLHPGQLPSVVVDAHQQQHQLPPVWPLMATQLGTETAASEGGSVLVRPGSMAERARLAKIPLPEPGLKCPRCDSTNTKFCYFNNYSLTQPRHFCKACRRYWTRGGALRSVPVGGVCRRNKRKKSSKHSSSLLSSSSTSALATGAAVTPSSAAAGVMPPQLQPPSGSLHPIWSDRYSSIAESRLGFPGLNSSLHLAVDYQLGDGLGLDRWRLQPTQQFPFLTPADSVPPQPSGLSLMSFDDAEAGNVVVAANLAGQMPARANIAGSGGLITQMVSVKMDDNPTTAATSSPRDFPGFHGRSQFCGTGDNGAGGYGGNGSGGTGITGGGSGGAAPSGGAWSDLSAFKYSPR